MEKVTIDDVRNEVNPLQVHDVRRPVSDELGTEHFAMNYFELSPGDSFSGGLHTHHDQEEVFYIESGTAEFEVGKERENVTVEAGEVIRFAPGEFQTGYAVEEDGNEVVGWALGAPAPQHDWEELESMIHCQECEEELPHGTTINAEGRFEFTCTECGNTFSM
ncbi:cupin domain-containing protein [Halovenus sp. WSH3]|uniref:Cupin domain-containing protein n=1 Tax=Halovenus carboxidivorans TaxID=2692199 RepID=A0A6B0T6K5_9EURY|nr:cupin domain-containing protein [Halovenus carboxidivorans]MXR50851.1 cupin domain-containing protein [Halovenus carboxidivorans]